MRKIYGDSSICPTACEDGANIRTLLSGLVLSSMPLNRFATDAEIEMSCVVAVKAADKLIEQLNKETSG